MKETDWLSWSKFFPLILLHSEGPKLYGVLAVLSAIGLIVDNLLARNRLAFLEQILSFNPVALRRSKTLWSFGPSECNRVNSGHPFGKKQIGFPRANSFL